MLNSTLFEGEGDRSAQRVFDVPATRMATELGNPLSASLVLLGAYSALTGLLHLESLGRGMRESVPSYRRQHLETNDAALRAGFESVPWNVAPAFPGEDHAA